MAAITTNIKIKLNENIKGVPYKKHVVQRFVFDLCNGSTNTFDGLLASHKLFCEASKPSTTFTNY